MRFIYPTLFFAFSFLGLAQTSDLSISDPIEKSVELHSHLFMKEGLSWFFNGGFFEPLRARNWSDRFSSQANSETVENSGIQILVATFYAHPLLKMSVRDSIRSQILQALRFVSQNKGWVIAKTPEEARQGLSQNKKILILALEGASGIIESDEDVREFIDEAGIRILTPLHFTDDRYGGVAFLKGPAVWATPLAYAKSWFTPTPPEGIRTNSNGLSPWGKVMLRKLAQHHVWIDLSHASDQAQRDIRELNLRQPALYTHTVLRKYHQAERGISQEQIQWIKESSGILGIMPSPQMLEGTPTTKDCEESIEALSLQYKEFAQILDPSQIMFGSDTNGAIPHLSSRCLDSRFAEKYQLTQSGFWNISHSSILWKALRNTGAPVPIDLQITVNRFLNTWDKIF